MKPIDFRDQTWSSLQWQICADRQRVLMAWGAHGPGTTRAVAAKAQIDLLSFRPRTTELFQIGAICVDESDLGRSEGVYRARSLDEWQAWFTQQQHSAVNGQIEMALP